MYGYGVPLREAKMKMEDGVPMPASAFLHVPDPDLPSTWKLPIWDEDKKMTVPKLGNAAAALGPGFRGQRVELPSEDRKAAAKKLIGFYRELDVESEKIPSYLWGIAGMKKPGGE